jgi:hypothetical protein
VWGYVVFQFHAINKIKLLHEAKGISIRDSNEKLTKGVTQANL